jgi:hypothetical protein
MQWNILMDRRARTLEKQDSPEELSSLEPPPDADSLPITRRRILRDGYLAAACSFLFPNADVEAALRWLDAEPSEPQRSDQIGRLDLSEKKVLWQFFNTLARGWEMDQSVELDRRLIPVPTGAKTNNEDTFYAFIDLTTDYPPSYLTEYRSAITFLNGPMMKVILKESCTVPAKLLEVIGTEKLPQGVEKKTFDSFKNVVGEFVIVILVSGGFKKIAPLTPLKNIQGFRGGDWDVAFRRYSP